MANEVVKSKNVVSGWIEKLKGFIKETRVEAKKVVWPDRRYIAVATSIVLIIVLVSSLFILFLDLGIAKIVLYLVKTF